MTPTPPSVASSSPGARSPPDAQFRVVRKRNRVPLSCGPCRHRKLKCNRSAPCDNCVKRGDSASCAYASPVGGRKRNQSSGSELSTPDEMQNRIDRLESLVLSLMGGGSQNGDVGASAAAAAAAAVSATRTNGLLEPPSQGTSGIEDTRDATRDEDSEVEHVSRSIGVMKVHHGRQFFASEAHWWAILSDIAEVKRYFQEHQKQYEEQLRKVLANRSGDQAAGTGLLFKGTAKIDKSRILVNFPARVVADKLITRYYQTENPAMRILHVPMFNATYERHWTHPNETPATWLGICFAMMSLALQSYHRAGDEPPEYRGKSKEMALTFSEWTAQCLVFADFTQPVNYMLEALIFYLQAEFSRNRDAETSIWMLTGLVVRLAMRMGLHRDSKPYASLNAFTGEMRRRVWSVVQVIDVLFSFQCGLPHMIRSNETNTALPANLYDEEFDENIKELPPARPASESTPMSFMINHSRMVIVFGRIQEMSVALVSPSYEATMSLDDELRHAYAQIPDHLRLSSPLESTEPSKLLMERYTLDLTYHKSQCILHRRYLSRARDNPKFAYSRRICIDSCLEMLAHQSALHVECQPGGRLRSVTWSITTSLTTHDFLLAAMIVCLDLYRTAQAEAKGNTSDELYTWALGRREAMFDAIKRAVNIWETLRDGSMEAYKASLMLTVMLEKLRNHEVLQQQLNNSSFSELPNGSAHDGQVAQERSAAMTLGLLRGGVGGGGGGGAGVGDGGGGGGSASTGITCGTLDSMDGYLKASGTGLTPQPIETATEGQISNGGLGDSVNLFTNFFGPNFGGFQGMEFPNTNLDWDGWDSYIQGPNLGNAQTNNIFESGYVDESSIVPNGQNESQADEKYPRMNAHPWVGPTPPSSNGVAPWT